MRWIRNRKLIQWIDRNIVTRIKNKIRCCGKCKHIYWEKIMCDPCPACDFGGSYVAVHVFGGWWKVIFKIIFNKLVLRVIMFVFVVTLFVLCLKEVRSIFISNIVMPTVCAEEQVEIEIENNVVLYYYDQLGRGGGYAGKR